MNYEDWLKYGGAITIRNEDPYLKSIIIPVTIQTAPNLCSDGISKMYSTYALIDTGATVSAIDMEVAKKLQLLPISKCSVNGVHGTSVVDMFSFNLHLMGSMSVAVKLATAGQFKTSAFKILIGMDILRLGELYLGQELKDGKPVTLFSFSIPPTGNTIDFADKLVKARSTLKKS